MPGVIILKKSLTLLFCATLILIIVIFAGFPHKFTSGKTSTAPRSSNILYNNTVNKSSSQGNSEAAAGVSTKASEFYIVKEYNGHIGVFKNGEDKPYKEYNVPVDTLPMTNQIKLQSGYKEANMDDVEKLIEDFDG